MKKCNCSSMQNDIVDALYDDIYNYNWSEIIDNEG
jgi:hypothetical protein